MIISLASQCASYEKTDNLRAPGKRALSIALVPYPAPSHMMGMATLGEKLIEQGHSVTFCVAQIFNTHYPGFDSQIANNTGMALLKPQSLSEPLFTKPTDRFLNRYVPRLKSIYEFTWRLKRITKQIVQMLDGPRMKSWDIVVGEYLLWPVVGSIARKWSVPVVHFSNALDYTEFNLPFWSYPLYGTGYTDDLTFFQRLHLTLFLPITKAVQNIFENTVLSSSGFTYDKSSILPGTTTPFIITTSFGFEYPRPVQPLVHYVGPVIKSEHAHNLLEGPLKTWLDSKSDVSVVFVGMGTTATLSKSEITAITDGILATRYNVLWNIKDTSETHYIYNLIRSLAGDQNKHRLFISEWLPQQTVLRHSSIAISILHGGMGGVSQCLYNGVPGIIIPFALDRYDVAARVVSSGAGLRLFKYELTTKRVTEAIATVSSPRYKAAALRLRKIFLHDGGTEKAVDLVEFYADVGYEHRVPAYSKYKWNWIQYYNVDVYAFLLTVLALALYGAFRVCKHTCKSRPRYGFLRKKTIGYCYLSVLLLVLLTVVVHMTFAD